MDTEKISELLEKAEEHIRLIEAGDADAGEVTILQWRVLESLAAANTIADLAKVRSPGSLLVRRLVIDEVERLVARCRRAVGVEQ